MQLLVDGRQFDLTQSFARGGEGELFSLDASNVAKVYHEPVREQPDFNERRQKVLALCNSYSNYLARHSDHEIAFPEFPAYEAAISFDAMVGFSITRYSYPTIEDLRYDLFNGTFFEESGFQFDDRGAVEFVYDAFATLDQLHQCRVILGDINPGNILCNVHSKKPVIIDIDSAQIGGFRCTATHPEYNDPNLALSGGLAVDFGTDVYALAVVCFEFLIGARPHMIHLSPPKQDVENKSLGISSIGCLSRGRSYLSGFGVSYFSCPENDKVENRLRNLQQLDRRLYDFFEAVFVRDLRENILFGLPLSDARHPGYRFFVESGFRDFIDSEVRRRQQATTSPSKLQGGIVVPDAGFRAWVNSLASPAVPGVGSPQASPVAVGEPKARPARLQRPDPANFDLFLHQFGLSVGT